MLSYLPDASARQRVRDLIAQAQTRDRQQAWKIKKHYDLESAQPKYYLWDRTTPRESPAEA
jgi:hypothetical protein